MITEYQKAIIVQRRGLGYSQKEIAHDLGISQKTVSYHLKKINEEGRKEGPEVVFRRIVIAGMGTHFLDFIERISTEG